MDGCDHQITEPTAKSVAPLPLTHNGFPIPPWTETGREYLVLERFPHLRRRFEGGELAGCLLREEREGLARLVERRRGEVGEGDVTPLHGKVSLLAGGNLAHVTADAVVNASNHWLTTGKGVNGVLHSAAGQCLLEECLSLGGCNVGEAKITSGYNLPARHVIHTVGPEGRDEDRGRLLRYQIACTLSASLPTPGRNYGGWYRDFPGRSCYECCLSLCLKHGIRTVAFSCISTGAYHYPSVEAADVALSTVREWLLTGGNADCIDRVVFVTRRPRDEESYGFLMLAYFPL